MHCHFVFLQRNVVNLDIPMNFFILQEMARILLLLLLFFQFFNVIVDVHSVGNGALI